ncbi:Carbohydrate-binding X8 domain superfamily protein [Arabidopsis thaliana]|uniref:At4g09090 n=2 Tax=Arabidopsis thaliana TaxID=3702 RepID=Q6NKV5_ARATH|nr:Carbohydrate-binding X8 domain superfamily protein [Arabidopsis thaliana]AAT06407.1 At4g09090 [Arabidopsis thaliana]AAV85690.1 At4g09090 [Arabidopsis thaliana]AEE82721.1 Carbohydrate-binding X8 domain superfamily protein [Arabidopsis thaliana]|eukprot:NP_192648.2 Carbohydrate-binding X8 domain superfamily protein [Arabidopsis thaliana]
MAKISSLLALLFIILSSIMINHLHVASSTKWCVAKMNATNAQLQGNINFGCSEGVDCGPIQPGGSCYIPNSLVNHASFVMNAYYQSHGRTKKACSFKNTGTFAVTDLSFGKCVYVS